MNLEEHLEKTFLEKLRLVVNLLSSKGRRQVLCFRRPFVMTVFFLSTNTPTHSHSPVHS